VIFDLRPTINISVKIKLSNELLWMCPVDQPNLIRLGGKMDGGYVVPQVAIDCAHGLLSLGLGDDFTFDQDWHTLKPLDPIHMYDASVTGDSIHITINPSVRASIDIKAEYKKFFQGNVQHIPEYISAENFAQALDRMGVSQVFVKMDIEGAEYALIDLFVEYHERIVGIAMEWHQCTKRNDKWRSAVQRLKQYYDIVHVHGNNHVNHDDENIFGCMELTHVRRDILSSQQLRKQIYLPGIDYSNVHGHDDFEYYFE
jgi:hypothetical protein